MKIIVEREVDPADFGWRDDATTEQMLIDVMTWAHADPPEFLHGSRWQLERKEEPCQSPKA